MKILVSGFAVTFFVAILATFVMMASGARIHRVKRSAIWPGGPKLTLDNLAQWAGLGNDVQFRETTGEAVTVSTGGKRCRLTQIYHGLEVMGASATAEMDSSGDLTGHIFGNVLTGIETDIHNVQDCTRIAGDMVNIAVVLEGFTPGDRNIVSMDETRIIYVHPVTGKAHLCYWAEFLYVTNNLVLNPVYVLDACDSKVLISFNKIQNSSHTTVNSATDNTDEPDVPCAQRRPKEGNTCDPSITGAGGNKKIGCVVYNERPNCLASRIRRDSCYMKNTHARVYDNKKSLSTQPEKVIQFDCDAGYQDAVNGAYGVANDAFFFGNLIGEFYKEKYAMRALLRTPKLVVHFGVNYENAFWNGHDMFFGDGYTTFYPLVSLDVTAHELAHGITSRNSKLVYKYQSGGINEAFSDISGETIEYYGRGAADWQVGWDIFKAARALRYLSDPPRDGKSIKHVRDYRNSSNVHFTSGIFNYAFYRMVQVEKMHIYDAYTCFLHANLLMWHANTNFTEGACGVLQACEDNGFKCEKVTKAFKEVGINFSDCDAYALTPVLYPGSSRSHVVVSSERNPTFEINLSKAKEVVNVTATTGAGKEITLKVTSDRTLKKVLIEEQNTLNITTTDVPSIVFLTLLTTTSKDTVVALKID